MIKVYQSKIPKYAGHTAGPWEPHVEGEYPGINHNEGSVIIFGYKDEECGIRGKDRQRCRRRWGMGREPWEIVRADELKVGDVVTIEPDLAPWVMDSVRSTDSHLFYRGDGIPIEYSMPRERNIFRRVDPADDPRVLRKALELASGQVVALHHEMMERRCPLPPGSVEHYAESCIDKARRELESEAENE